MIYDGLLIIAMFFIAGFGLIAIYGPADEVGQSNIPQTIYQLTMIVIVWLFYGIFWLKSGQTLGMQAWKIKLEAANGGPVTPRMVALRLLSALVSLAPAGLGYWWALVDREGRTWHDRLSGTRLVRKNRGPAGETKRTTAAG